jgi:hypothetical protein
MAEDLLLHHANLHAPKSFVASTQASNMHSQPQIYD